MKTWERLYIDGQWVRSSDDTMIDVHDSVTEEVMETIPAGNSNDAAKASAAAGAALSNWSNTPVEQRVEYINAIADGLRSRANDIAPLIAREVGMPIDGSLGYQTMRACEIFETLGRVALDYSFEETLGSSIVLREPVGVVAAIGPSNFPLLLALNKVGAALAAGCTVILKPPETAPGSLFHLAEVADDVGLPPGVLNLVSGYGPDIGAPLATDPAVDMISFTGSTAVGRRLLELGASTIKRAHLELGGKSAAIVLDDADLESALTTILDQAYINAGQVCFAWSRVIVPRSRMRLCEEILADVANSRHQGDPLDPSVTIGPIVTSTARDRVTSYINGALDEGARLVAGGSDQPDGLDRGYFVQPTVLSDVDNRSRIAQEEVFGPVVAIIAHDGDDHAVALANDSIYGLHGAVFSENPDRAQGVARRVRTGVIDINGFKLGADAPFGGFKQSGLGRELGVFGLEEYLEVKAIQP